MFGQANLGTAEISFVIISKVSPFVKKYFAIFQEILGTLFTEVFLMVFGRKCALFCLGGLGYVALELLYRGRSHISMFLAGGSCLLLVGKLNHTQPKLPLPLRAVAGAGIITMVELAAGLLFNREYRVWDYRDQPGNWLGQICPVFSLLWIGAAALVLLIYDPLENAIAQAGADH